MKKIIPIISFVLLFTYTLLGQTIVSIPDVYSPLGEEVDVSINTSLDGVNAVTLYITYDSTVVKYKGIENSVLPGAVINNISDSLIIIQWSSTTAVDIESKILDLKFDFTSGTSNISFDKVLSYIEVGENPENIDYQDGTVGPLPISFTLSEETGLSGDTVEVELTAVNLTNIAEMDIYIDYEDSNATFIGLKESITDFGVGNPDNKVIITMASLTGFDHSSGTLTKLQFVINSGNTALEFDTPICRVVDIDGNNVVVSSYISGSVGEEKASMILGEVKAIAGTEVTVPFSGLKLEGITNFDLWVEFDAASVEYVSFSQVTSEGALAVSNPVDGKLLLTYANIAGMKLIDDKIAIADLVFNYKKDSTSLVFDLASASVQDENGNVTIKFVDGTISEETVYEVTIKEIQGEVSESPYVGLAVKTTGIVTASKTGTYFLQDGTGAWNGIFVHDYDNSTDIGDEVTLTAFVKEYYGKTELSDIVKFAINSSGNTLPASAIITAAEFGEPYEGVLVTVEEAEVTDADLGHGEWELTDATGSTRADDLFYKSTPDSGVIVTVTGVGDYSYSNYKILPRDSVDVFFHDMQEGIIALDHNTGNLVVSVLNNGTIGANKFDDINYGSGIIWKGTNGFWRAGPVFGTAAKGSVNGQAHNNNSIGFFDLTTVESDFTAGFYAETKGTVDFDQVSDAIITDDLATIPYGLDITQKSYSKTGEDVVYIEYTFANNTGAEVADLSAGLFMDYDVTPYKSNTGGYSKSENLAYQYVDGSTGPMFGVVALNGLVGAKVTSENAADLVALREAAYGFITTFDENHDPGVGDQRTWIGSVVGTIADGASKKVTFAIVAADDLHDIRANAEKAFILGKQAGLTTIVVGVKRNGFEIPMNYEISQNYPNPFNPATVIQYALPLQSHVKINVYNTLGQLVDKLVDTDVSAGHHQVQFNASNLSSGVYFYSIQAEAVDGSENFQIVKKMMLVK